MIKFKAIPLDLSSEETESFDKALEIFNQTQNEFQVEKTNPMKFSQDSVISWPTVKTFLGNVSSENRIMGITSKKFNDNWFSHSEGKVTVISTSDWSNLFSPPGLHCYILLELTLATYFHASNISELDSGPHNETQGCLLDLCANKSDSKWKLRVGYICSSHSAYFRRYGGSEEQIEAIQALLDEVRRVSLGRPSCRILSKPNSNETIAFTMESLKKHPLVVAATIITLGIGIGWGVAWKVWIEPKNDRITILEKQVTEIKTGNDLLNPQAGKTNKIKTTEQ